MSVRLFPDERCPFLPVAVTSEARGTVLSEVRGTVHGADALRCAKRCAVRNSWRGAGRGVERCVARKKYSNFSSYNYGNAGRLPAICRRLPSCAIRLFVRPGLRLPAPAAVCLSLRLASIGWRGYAAGGVRFRQANGALAERVGKRLRCLGRPADGTDVQQGHACPVERPPKARRTVCRKVEAGTRMGLQRPRVKVPVPHGSRSKTQAGRGSRRAPSWPWPPKLASARPFLHWSQSRLAVNSPRPK